jgi:hypothetical protein
MTVPCKQIQTFSMRHSLLHPQDNGKFYVESRPPIILGQGCHRGWKPVLHYQKSVTSIMDYFVKQILLKK